MPGSKLTAASLTIHQATNNGPRFAPEHNRVSFEAGICYFDGLHTSTKTITFDGRLDNREELQSRLGGSFPPDATDAALALAAYEKWGIDGLAHLVGDWSLAIRDGARKTVVRSEEHTSELQSHSFISY